MTDDPRLRMFPTLSPGDMSSLKSVAGNHGILSEVVRILEHLPRDGAGYIVPPGSVALWVKTDRVHQVVPANISYHSPSIVGMVYDGMFVSRLDCETLGKSPL